jgi:hypothetical protein
VAAGVGHNYRAEDAAALEAWLLQKTWQMPKHFSFIVDTPQHRGIWGISIPRIYPDAYPQAEPRVKFECWIEGSTIRIRTWDAKTDRSESRPQRFAPSQERRIDHRRED